MSKTFKLAENVMNIDENMRITSIRNKRLPMPKMERLPRTSLLLRPAQMIREGYPQPDELGYVSTKSDYDKVTDQSPMFSLRCEFAYDQNGDIEIAWVILVSEDLEVFQEIFVKSDQSYLDLLRK